MQYLIDVGKKENCLIRKEKHLTRAIWIVMGVCVCDEGTGYVTNINIGFE